tara:strand:+ start:3704 stop:5011 length:1308 start_codon:yes stop_codon:yes gene_type:complete
MKNLSKRIVLATLFAQALCLGALEAVAQTYPALTLENAIEQAVLEDDWLAANVEREQAMLEEALAAAQLPDPRVSIGLSNLPLDTFNLGQEPMTQLRVGINQVIPRGDTLLLSEQKKKQQSEVNPFLRADRKAKVELLVSQLWLKSFLSARSIALIEADRSLFQQLIDITSSRYTVGAGLARQQDVVRAQLELLRLDDRLAVLRQAQDSNKQQLAQWVPSALIVGALSDEIPQRMPPQIRLATLAEAAEFFETHPRIRSHDKQIEVAATQVALAKQSLKPEYTVGAAYGYRDNAPGGINRADFLTLELSFDVPLFAEKRQKPLIRASQHSAAAIQVERTLIVKELFANYQQAVAELNILDERRTLYADLLLAQINDLTEATLSAYTADEGDFEEVMRAYIAELNTKIDLLQIDVERLQVLARLDYLLAGSAINEE